MEMTDQNQQANDASLIWDEYKYRHEHCWATIYRLTGAAVVLGLVPYVATSSAWPLRYWLLAPPFLAISLIVIAMLRMHSELYLLRQVKERHRNHQEKLYDFVFPRVRWRGTFDLHVWSYLFVLLVLAGTNIAIAASHLETRRNVSNGVITK
jgi:hypothetical protein